MIALPACVAFGLLLCLVAFACAPKIDVQHRRCLHVYEATNEGIEVARERVKRKVFPMEGIFSARSLTRDDRARVVG
jgi:hypothetical protein